MPEITITINSNSPMEAMVIKNSLQTLATNFNKDNLSKMADLSKMDNPNEKIKNLFDNPFFKMATKK